MGETGGELVIGKGAEPIMKRCIAELTDPAGVAVELADEVTEPKEEATDEATGGEADEPEPATESTGERTV